MKKSRIAKLALLGASTAALAATLTTSTYAWYVSNQTATVSATTGTTAGADSDGSVSLSTTGIYGSFKKSISLGNASTTLSPVHSSDGKTFYSISLASNAASPTSTAVTPTVLGYGADANAGVYHYSFWVLVDGTYDSTTTKTITPTFTITNTTATSGYKPQVNYSSELTLGTNVGPGETFYVNALNALSFTGFKTQAGEYDPDTYEDADAVTTELSGKTASAIGAQMLTDSLTSGQVLTETEHALPNGALIGTQYAQEYYEEIAGATLTQAQKQQITASAFSTFTVLVGAPALLDFYLYLDGADQQCFNACEQQSLSVQMSFTVA